MAERQPYPLRDFLQGKGDVEFNEFVTTARASGLRPEMWVREKRSGKLQTELLEDGRHVIRAVSAESE